MTPSPAQTRWSRASRESAPNLGIAAANISGTITDGQVSDTLTSSSAANADTLDGNDSTDFLPAAKLVKLTRTRPPSIYSPGCITFNAGPFSGGNVRDPVFVSATLNPDEDLVVSASPALALSSGLSTHVKVCNFTHSDIQVFEITTFELVLVSN